MQIEKDKLGVVDGSIGIIPAVIPQMELAAARRMVSALLPLAGETATLTDITPNPFQPKADPVTITIRPSLPAFSPKFRQR